MQVAFCLRTSMPQSRLTTKTHLPSLQRMALASPLRIYHGDLKQTLTPTLDERGIESMKRHNKLFKVREKRLRMAHSVTPPLKQKHGHYPLCAFTANPSRRSAPFFAVRTDNWRAGQPKDESRDDRWQTHQTYGDQSRSRGWGDNSRSSSSGWWDQGAAVAADNSQPPMSQKGSGK